jgi:hypothetical protein
MKKIIILGVIGIITLVVNGGYAAEVPHELAGFVLGGEMNDYKDLLKLDTTNPGKLSGSNSNTPNLQRNFTINC